MISLNLIPNSFTERFRWQHLYALVQNRMLIIIFYLVAIGMVLLSARFFLTERFIRVVDETTLVTRENRSTQSSIASLNQEISTATLLGNKINAWPQFLASFAALVPPEVTITSLHLSIDKESTLSGQAATREGLLAFRDALAKAPYITNITLPVKDLLERRDVKFTVTFKVVLNKLPTTP